jgi:spore germination cell wall hydrolase CwlJ-like protein
MLKSWISALLMGLAALLLSGCETSGVAVAPPVASYANVENMAVAPIPATKPTADMAMNSLAADVEAGTETQAAFATPQPIQPVTIIQPPLAQPMAVAFAPDSGSTAIAPATIPLPAKKAIPTEAINVASATHVNVAPIAHNMRDRECLMRAMYFESNRSSRDGQLAVGTVVMHRIKSGIYPNTVCGVVGQNRQFAPGVMTRRMQGDTTDLAKLADAILGGLRHPKIFDRVMFFHTAGLKFKYGNMHYVLVAGGNTFYEKVSRRRIRRS